MATKRTSTKPPAATADETKPKRARRSSQRPAAPAETAEASEKKAAPKKRRSSPPPKAKPARPPETDALPAAAVVEAKIREEAYLLAERHGFEGDPAHFWLMAEQRVAASADAHG